MRNIKYKICYPFATPRPKPRRPAPSSFFFKNSVLFSLVCIAPPSTWSPIATFPRSSDCWFCWTGSSAVTSNTRKQQAVAIMVTTARCISAHEKQYFVPPIVFTINFSKHSRKYLPRIYNGTQTSLLAARIQMHLDIFQIMCKKNLILIN